MGDCRSWRTRVAAAVRRCPAEAVPGRRMCAHHALQSCNAFADRAQVAGNDERRRTLRGGTGFGGCLMCQAIEASLQNEQPAIQIPCFRANSAQPVLHLLEFSIMTILKIRQALNDRQHLLDRTDRAGHRVHQAPRSRILCSTSSRVALICLS